MGNNSIPLRLDGQTIDASWFNALRTALTQAIVPRNSDGIATDEAGNLGESTLRFLNAYFMNLLLMNGTKAITLQAPAGLGADYTISLPAALPSLTAPMQLDTNGNVVLTPILRQSLPEIGPQMSGSVTASTTSLTFAAVSGLSVTITTTGRPVYVFLQPDGHASNPGYVSVDTSTLNSTASGRIAIYRNGSVISQTSFSNTNSGGTPAAFLAPAALSHLDIPSAGTHTYQIYLLFGGGTSGNIAVNNVKLVAFEL